MKLKSAISIIICFAFVSTAVSVMATDTGPITSNGTGTATVSNTGPSLTGTRINDGVGWVANLDVNTQYFFYVNVSDVNTLDDIASVTMEIYIPTFETADNVKQRYKFRYDETTNGDSVFAGTWTQIMPTTGSYIASGACLTPGLTTSNSGSYVFAITPYSTSLATTWRFNASVTDSTGAKASIVYRTFSFYKYLEMSYDTGGGSQNFAWSGLPGTQNVADTFDVTVTSNVIYTLSAAYENRFYNATNGVKWANEPSLEVQYYTYPKVALTNVTSSYTNWITILTPIGENQVTTHTIYLDFEYVLPALTYTGVTIYIRASV
ncbi:MAG: hypothetical protein FP824_01195 [Euryarchaeota archaeon]|nr:hypothetical protein [Euryarchaeota archaeon]MBU4071855.1 hypothetical protein [Candidatus Thermoplasmatota archaeon]